MSVTYQQIKDALIAQNELVTRQFFFKNCRPLFVSIIRSVFSYEVDYDEFVNEFYMHLMENDAYRLRQFEGRSSIYQWMKVVAIRYFIAKRDRMIENESEEPLIDKAAETTAVNYESQMVAKVDIERLLKMMQNRKYEYVIRRLILHEAEPKAVAEELGTNVDNLYNIKKRALASLTKLALKEIEKYGTKTDN